MHCTEKREQAAYQNIANINGLIKVIRASREHVSQDGVNLS